VEFRYGADQSEICAKVELVDPPIVCKLHWPSWLSRRSR
jgi:hypothetical protein